MDTGRLIATTVNTSSETHANDAITEEIGNVAEAADTVLTEGSDNTSTSVVKLSVLNTIISLKRRKSDSVDSVQEDAVSNVKRQKQEANEILEQSAAENNTENETTEERENDGQTEYITLKDRSENDGQSEYIRLKDGSENDGQTEHTTLKEVSESDGQIDDNELKYGAENDRQTGDTTLKHCSDNDAETEDITLSEGSGNDRQTENIVLNECSKNDGQSESGPLKVDSVKDVRTENIALKNCSENDKHSEDITVKEEPEKDKEMDDIALKEGRGDFAMTEDHVLKEGSENGKTAEQTQDLRGKDQDTWVIEDHFIERKDERLGSSLPLISPDYHHTIKDAWLEVRIKRSPEAEPADSPNEGIIYVYNTSRTTCNSKHVVKDRFPDVFDKQHVFFHGTTTDHAECIIERGIDVTMSRRRVDFSCGKGFYVTKDYGRAFVWSKRKEKYSGSKPAFIAFKFDRAQLQKETHLSLDLHNTREFWECIVSHFRNGGSSPDVTRALSDVKYIEGPVAKNWNKDGKVAKPVPAFTQMCICNQGFAKWFGSLANILCVVFIND